MRLKTKLKIDTKVAVALAAGAVVLAAAAAGGFSFKKDAKRGFFATQGYSSGRTYLDVRFGSSGAIKAQPGDTGVVMGEYKLKAVGTDLTVSDFNVGMLVQDVPSSAPFGLGIDGPLPVEADEHLSECVLIDSNTGNTMMGPVYPSLSTSSTHLLFTDDFYMTQGQTLKLSLECNFNGFPPNGNEDRFAVDILTRTDVTAVDPSSSPVWVALTTSNGNPPNYQVVLK